MDINLLDTVSSPEESATIVCALLKEKNIDVVLTGGSCMEIYTNSNYSSYDLDFIANPGVKAKQVIQAMLDLGFEKTTDGYFKYSRNPYLIEFPTGPVTVGDERPLVHQELKTHIGTLTLLTPTNCVKDRLCAYFYHGGEECYTQAVAVAHKNNIDKEDLIAWAKNEKSEIDKVVDSLLTDLSILNEPKNNATIKKYLKSKETTHFVDINIETDFIELTDDLIEDYVLHTLLNIKIEDKETYYQKMKKLYVELKNQ